METHKRKRPAGFRMFCCITARTSSDGLAISHLDRGRVATSRTSALLASTSCHASSLFLGATVLCVYLLKTANGSAVQLRPMSHELTRFQGTAFRPAEPNRDIDTCISALSSSALLLQVVLYLYMLCHTALTMSIL